VRSKCIRFVAVCLPTWTALVNKLSLNGVRQNSLRIVASCQAYCIDVPSCVAIDFNFLDTSCWVHLDTADLDPVNVYDQFNTTQYRINRTCAPVTTVSTPSTVPPTTTAGLRLRTFIGIVHGTRVAKFVCVIA